MAEATRVFLASRNAKKIEEMRRILDQHLPGITHAIAQVKCAPRRSSGTS